MDIENATQDDYTVYGETNNITKFIASISKIVECRGKAIMERWIV